MIQYTVPTLLLAVTLSATSITHEVEAPSIDDVAREYRIHTYDTYRTQRAEYNRRIEIGKEAVDRYKSADANRQQEILNWFVQSTSGAALPLPGGQIQAPDQIAGDAAEVVTEAIVFDAPGQEESQSNEFANSNSNDVVSGELDFDSPVEEQWNEDDDETFETSVVRTEKFGITSKSRTFSILGSVGRAVTVAVAKRGGGEGLAATENEFQFEGVDETTEIVDEDEVIIEEEPTPAELGDEALNDDDLDLEQLILESPASDNDALEPTPETFLRDSSWRPNSSSRLARRVEKIEKSLHRITVRLDMPGMSVHQIEGAVELAEELCWNYRAVATYLEATGSDKSILDVAQIRGQVQRLADRLNKGVNIYKEAVKEDPSISHYIVTLEELILRTEMLQGEIA